MNSIIIKQLQTYGIIGVYPEERHNPQELLLDIEMELAELPAGQSDQLDDTIDYAAVCQTVKNYISQSQYQLLETLAEQTAQLLLATYRISSCCLTIYKKPMDIPEIKHVAVKIKRSLVTT